MGQQLEVPSFNFSNLLPSTSLSYRKTSKGTEKSTCFVKIFLGFLEFSSVWQALTDEKEKERKSMNVDCNYRT